MRFLYVALIITACTFSVANNIYADIGENFDTGGIALSGSISFNYWPHYGFFKDWDKTFNLRFSAQPNFHFFILKNLALTLNPNVMLTFTKLQENDEALLLDYGLTTGLTYFIVPQPDKETGFVFSCGLRMGINAGQPLYTKATEVTFLNSNYLSLQISPEISFYYFIMERVALYISAISQIYYSLYDNYPGREEVNLTLTDRTSFSQSIFIGISWFRPSKSVILIPLN